MKIVPKKQFEEYKEIKEIIFKCKYTSNYEFYSITNYELLIRKSYSNTLEQMSDSELVRYFQEVGTYKLLLILCEVLKEFHQINKYHGGVKISNILLNDDEFMLVDHWMKLLQQNNQIITNTNVNYISPEELEGNEIDIGVDQWQIGVLLYKILSGIFPFEGKSRISTEFKIITVDYSELEIEFSHILNPLISKLLKKDSRDRIKIEDFEKEINNINQITYLPSVPVIHEVNNNNNFPLPLPIPLLHNKSLAKQEICVFMEENKHKDISIITEDKLAIIRSTGVSGYAHCYLSNILTSGIYHFIFKLNGNNGGIAIGGNTNNVYTEDFLYNDKSSCCIRIGVNISLLSGGNGEKLKDEHFRDVLAVDNSIYEVIIDCDRKCMSIKQDNGKLVDLFRNISFPLFMFVGIASILDCVKLESCSKE